MSRKVQLNFKPDSADYLLRRYLKITILQFTPEMGRRLVEIREKNLRCTQRQLADQLGISQTDISRLENGKRVNSLPNSEIFKNVLDKYFTYVCFGDHFIFESELTIEKHKRDGKWWVSLKK